jgi:tetratricopeptide (TPR) repeat protein
MRGVSFIRTAVVVFVASFVVPVCTDAQQAPQEYQKLVDLAQFYARERRFEAALSQWAKAYALQPSPHVLAEMGKEYLALGRTDEADESFSKVLAEGGEISLDFLHRHRFGQCYGSLTISTRQIRWAGKDKEDSYQVVPREIGDIQQVWYYVNTWGVRGITMPLFRLRAANKSWTYEFLLYGQGKYKTETEGWTDKYVIYLAAGEREEARKATELIVRMLSRLSAAPDVTPVLQ